MQTGAQQLMARLLSSIGANDYFRFKSAFCEDQPHLASSPVFTPVFFFTGAKKNGYR